MFRRDFVWKSSLAAVGTYLVGKRAWVQGISAAPLPDGVLSEVVSMRTKAGKTFHLGGDKYRIIHGMKPKHAPIDPKAYLAVSQERDYAGGWKDLNYEWKEVGGKLVCEQGWYTVTVDPRDPVAMLYESALGGSASMRMTGLALRQTPPMHIPQGLRWESVAKDFDVELHLKATGVEWFKRIKTGVAPKSWGWVTEETPDFHAKINWHAQGWDNADTTVRQNESMFVRKYRPVQMELRQERRFDALAGVWRTDAVETWTGKVIALEPVTRIKTLSSDVTYPVWIDADIDEAVTDDADDVTERVGYSDINVRIYSYGGGLRAGAAAYLNGWRWVNVAWSNGATHDDSTVRVNCTGVTSGGVTVDIRFDEVANASAWSNGSRPSQISQTGGTGTLAFTSTGLKSLDVSTDMGEVVAAGLSNGNAIRASGLNPTGDGSQVSTTGDLTDLHSAVEAVLEINYTAGGGGGGSTPPLGGLGLGNVGK